MSEKDFFWKKYPNKVSVFTFKETTHNILTGLLEIILQNKNKFFSVTNNQDEITLCYDVTLNIKFSENDCIYKEMYVAYQLLNTSLLIEQPGLIKKVSSLFGNNKIPIFYIATFNNDYVLVPEKYEQDADKIVNDVFLTYKTSSEVKIK